MKTDLSLTFFEGNKKQPREQVTEDLFYPGKTGKGAALMFFNAASQ
jgi:hypothetical protein